MLTKCGFLKFLQKNVSFEYLIIYMAQKPLENENFKEEPKFSIWGGILTS